ncbi:MAG: hypothetical protein RJA07_1836 [Bacteroidota bacterium]|jgi:hypothetical protein
MNFQKSVYLLVIAFCFVFVATAQTTTLIGKVTDAKTGEKLQFVTIYLMKAQTGDNTDENGGFTIKTTTFPDTLITSFVGYKTVKIFLATQPKEKINIAIEQNLQQLHEVSVVFFKDPGKHLMQMVIDNKTKNDLKRFDNSVFNEYRKTEIDIYNLDTKSRSGFFKNIAKIYNSYNNDSTSTVAPIYFTEKFFRTYHSNNLQTNIEHLVSTKQLGLSTDKLGNKLDKFEFKINIYDAIIPILKTSFLSPVSKLGLSYYHFIPSDTVEVGDNRYIKVTIIPKVKNENTFTGVLYVEDKTFAITQFDIKTSKGSNINFVDNISIKENFISIANKIESKANIWIPNNYSTTIEFNNGLDLIGIPIKGDSSAQKIRLTNSSIFNDYIINSENLNANNFYNTSKTVDSSGVKSNSISTFDDVYRIEKLSSKEQAIYNTFDSLKHNRKFVSETKLTSVIATGYYDFGCKHRVGPYSSLVSTNQIEGLRLRSGFWTLPCVSKTFNFNGYIAHGFKDNTTKGGLGIKYVPTTKHYMKTELLARSDYDLILDFDDVLDADNIFTLALRKNIPAYQTFIRQIKLLQEIDVNNNWSVKASVCTKTLNPTFDYSYYKLNHEDEITDFTPLKKIAVNEFAISLRYAHNERTTIFNYDKIRITSAFPVFTLNYINGFEITNNNFFEYQKLVANLTQEVTLPVKGSLFYSATAGQLFGTVPALLLFAPNGNAYYVANKYTFNNMLPYEFAADRFASLMLRYNMGGLLLNKIPFINKLNLRERFTFNNYMGVMSKSNRDFNSINPIKTTGLKPYSEAGVGIGNIFNVLSLDAIWRLSQFNNKQALTRFGIYTTVTLVF